MLVKLLYYAQQRMVLGSVRGEVTVRKWAFLLTSALAIVSVSGCGGGAGSSGGGGGGAPVDLLSQVNTSLLNSDGIFEVTYNTGAGRAPGSITAVVGRVYAEDDLGRIQTVLIPERSLLLDGYTSQRIDVPVPIGGFSTAIASRGFSEFFLEIARLRVENDFGGFDTISGLGGAPIVLASFPMNVRTFPGRRSGITVYLEPGMFEIDDSDVTFDDDLFEILNFADGAIQGSFSDFLAFDITGVASKPLMSDSTAATRVFFSGDHVALAGPQSAANVPFEVLVPGDDPIEGLVSNPPASLTNAPGTYALRQIDPRDLTNEARIIAQQGIWRPFTIPGNISRSPIIRPGAFECILMPRNSDDEVVSMILFSQSAPGQVNNLYYGFANLEDGTFEVYPIAEYAAGATAGALAGTLNGFVFRPGVVSPTFRDIRSGTFAIEDGTVPATFQQTGRFIVYRL